MIPLEKNYFRRNKWNLAVLLIYLSFCIYSIQQGIININNIDNSFHISLLTINSVFSGFLFTSLGIMVSIADKERISVLDKAGYMDNYYNSIYLGIIFHVISAVIALILILFESIQQYHVLVYIEQLALLGGVLFFVKSVYNIINIVGKVRRSL